jgi:hypothetical protein
MSQLVSLLAAIACLLAVGACSHDDGRGTSSALAAKVDPRLGDSYPVVASATGPMDLELAAGSTAVPSRLLKPFLRQHGYQFGYSRVWQRGTEVRTALGLHFFADRNADDFVTFSADRLATSAYFVPFTDSVVPGSRGFQLTSKVRGATRFCSGEYFSVDRDAFVVTHCADFPVPSQSVAALAQRQLVFAVTGSE